jgi:hypothetical protein
MGKEKCIRAIVEQPEGKRTPGGLRLRWEDNTKMDLKEIGWEGVDWFQPGSGQGQVAGSSEHGSKPSGSIKWEHFLT